MQDAIIRILEKDSNRRGDLFGRLMADLFVALGYEQPRLNIHKSGRELDLAADHRLEPRSAIGECKATAEPIGGGDLNKFVGALDVEREDKRPVTGYFISLGGFRETAIEQEKQRRNKIVTLNGSQVVSELVKGRILVAKERATELAGRCCAALAGLTLDPEAELLAHERGWIWAIYYTQGKARTHFALIHSDGTPLARSLTNEIVASDRDCGGGLEGLVCLNPEPSSVLDSDSRVAEALAAYSTYLSNECGFIQLDGMPADSEVGSRRLRLENLFVPLHLDVTARVSGEEKKMEHQPVGAVLSDYPRLALLAAPGGGKSTLIKRLAVAYADPARRGQIDDNLPARDWLPLFFRCRELRDLARGSFAELIEALSQREPVRQHAAVFRAYVDRALLAGRVLLLVDGLDEISDPGDRAAFVCTMRAALHAYPGIAFVVTSREAGFRHVAAHLAPICTYAVVSAFDHDDIRRISVSWHREVVGDTEKVRTDAEHLANSIVQNDRIRRLAANPLLLTTLLLVKRWVGALPTRRAVLYGKAVEVLLMTWNTEGHEPIPEEEALPQLCYVASAMMLDKVERISRPKLASLLREARESLPSELGYVKDTVEEFINRVEDRSSLLMMTGNDVEDGRLVEFFEFRHLTFQEFLTARALVEGWHPGRKDEDTLVSVLQPHFADEKWREVIPLAALLGGKETEALIRGLTEQVRGLDRSQLDLHKIASKGMQGEYQVILALGNCLADEAPAKPETIRAAMAELVRAGEALYKASFMPALVRGRYGMEFCEAAHKALLTPSPDLLQSMYAFIEYVWWRTIESEDAVGFARAAMVFVERLNSSEHIVRCEGATGLMYLCYSIHSEEHRGERDACAASIVLGVPALLQMVFSKDTSEQYFGCIALVWLGACRIWLPTAQPDILGRLFELWKHGEDEQVQGKAAWALGSFPLADRDADRWCASIPKRDLKQLGLHPDEKGDDFNEEIATLVVAWYTRTLPDKQIVRRAQAVLTKHKYLSKHAGGRILHDLLERLGVKTERHE